MSQAATAAAYEVRANNLSRASENKIHDDSVAQRFGFTGALVPGVEVHAYACHPAVARWGRDWLARGRIESRFLKPVFPGDTLSAIAARNGNSEWFKLYDQATLSAAEETDF